VQGGEKCPKVFELIPFHLEIPPTGEKSKVEMLFFSAPFESESFQFVKEGNDAKRA